MVGVSIVNTVVATVIFFPAGLIGSLLSKCNQVYLKERIGTQARRRSKRIVHGYVI